MRIKPFNEILDGLKGAGTTNATGKTEELAEQLHTQGIATTMMDAREKAKSMISTEQHVTEDFTEKRKTLTNYNDPRNNQKYNKYRAAMVDEIRQRAMAGPQKIQVQDEFQTPGFERRNRTTTPITVEEPQEQVPQESEVTPEPTRVVEPTSTIRPGPIPEPTQKTSSEASKSPQKKQNEFVDLADIFSFGKK